MPVILLLPESKSQGVPLYHHIYLQTLNLTFSPGQRNTSSGFGFGVMQDLIIMVSDNEDISQWCNGQAADRNIKLFLFSPPLL